MIIESEKSYVDAHKPKGILLLTQTNRLILVQVFCFLIEYLKFQKFLNINHNNKFIYNKLQIYKHFPYQNIWLIFQVNNTTQR